MRDPRQHPRDDDGEYDPAPYENEFMAGSEHVEYYEGPEEADINF